MCTGHGFSKSHHRLMVLWFQRVPGYEGRLVFVVAR
jgi:hypothetical protein